jgi:hypothetical protein
MEMHTHRRSIHLATVLPYTVLVRKLKLLFMVCLQFY